MANNVERHIPRRAISEDCVDLGELREDLARSWTELLFFQCSAWLRAFQMTALRPSRARRSPAELGRYHCASTAWWPARTLSGPPGAEDPLSPSPRRRGHGRGRLGGVCDQVVGVVVRCRLVRGDPCILRVGGQGVLPAGRSHPQQRLAIRRIGVL
jgi:hypothetical protein